MIRLMFILLISFLLISYEVRAEDSISSATIPCSDNLKIKESLKTNSTQIKIIGNCSGNLDLSYLKTDSSIALIGITAQTVFINNAHISGSFEISDSKIEKIVATDAEIGQQFLIFSTQVINREVRDGSEGHNYDDDENGCGSLNIPDRLVFESIDLSRTKMNSLRLKGLEINNDLVLINTIVESGVSLYLVKAKNIRMAHIKAIGLDINASESNEITVTQAKIEANLVMECSRANSIQVWSTSIGDTLSFQGASFKKLDAFLLNAGEFDISSAIPEDDVTLKLSYAKVRLFTPFLSDPIKYKELDVTGMVTDAIRTKGVNINNPLYIDNFVREGAKSDSAFPVRIAKSLANSGQIDLADKILRHGSWLNVIRSYVGQAGFLLLIFPVLLILFAWFLLGVTIKKNRKKSLDYSMPDSALERLILSIDLFLPDLVDLCVRSKFEEYLKSLSWKATLLVFLYRLAGWACISLLLVWITLRWSY